jgi:tetratricopeptide (TPR) repeat protein
MKFYYTILSLFITGLLLSGCQPESAQQASSQEESHLGSAHLEVTGSEAALPHFKEGLLLLHSFEYDDARAAFQEALEVDPDFVMAYWGEAMTHNRGLWRSQDYEDGQAVLAKVGESTKERLDKAATELEKDLFQGVEILYGEGTKYERDEAYAEHMGKLYKKYPQHQEVAAFYALSLLGSVPVGRDEEVYEQSAAIAQSILNENPSHPGALHYLIHSYDDPNHAVKAITAANSYAKVAPDAAHALHMPSHIYVAMGMWDEVVRSNIDSYQASLNRMERMGLDNNARSYHAFHWLLYGYLQQGKLGKAHQIMDDMFQYTSETPSKGSRSYLIRMKGNYLVETGDWTGDMSGIEIYTDGLNISLVAMNDFIDGRVAYAQGDKEKIQTLIKKMNKERDNAAVILTDDGVPMCSAGSNRSLPNQMDIDQAQIFAYQLEALLAMLNEDDQKAEEYLKKATELERNASYAYGPPAIVKPTFEMYGDWLLEQNRPEDALAQFEYALKRGPKRHLALKGKRQAAEMSGKEEMVAEVNEILAEIKTKAAGEGQEL